MTHRITPYPHEARRFQEAGSVLIVREVEPQPDPDVVVQYDPNWLLFTTVAGDKFRCLPCPFPAVGEEVWFAEDHSFGISENPDDHGQVAFSWGMADAPRRGLHPDSPDGSENWCRRWKQVSASEMPEWAARLRGVVVSRECLKLDQATQRLVTGRDGCGLRSRHKLRYHWTKNSKTPFDADPWAWVVRVEKR